MNLRVSLTPRGALAKLARSFRLPQDKLIRGIGVQKFADAILEYLKETTPRGKASPRLARVKGRIISLTGSQGDLPLRETWRVRRNTALGPLGFDIYSLLETQGGARGLIKLRSIEYGHKAYSYVAKRRFTFRDYMDGKRVYTTIEEGRVIKQPATEGKHLIKKTEAYILTELLPRLARDARDNVRSNLGL